MHHIADVGFMLGDELKYFPVLDIEGPIPQLLNIPASYFIDGKKLLIVAFMFLEEAVLTDETGWLFTVRVNANVEYFFPLVARNQAFGCD